MMDAIAQKINQWIKDGKDPRSAHWQGGLEAMLNVFTPYLEPGKLIPVQPLEEDELAVFLSALEVVDLHPGLIAAFLPPAIAEKVVPPDSADELHHIAKGKPSYKILIARSGKEQRILCAEISEHAEKPGVDIFQSGALLGTYNFENQEDCLAQFAKILKTHIWEKGKWSIDDHKRYTFNWFEKVLDLHKGTVYVEKDFSFFHSPTLIRSNKIDAIFTLIFETLMKRFNDPEGQYKDSVASIQTIKDKTVRAAQFKELVDQAVLYLLSVMKELDLVKYDELTEKEVKQFINESARTIRLIVNKMVS